MAKVKNGRNKISNRLDEYSGKRVFEEREGVYELFGIKASVFVNDGGLKSDRAGVSRFFDSRKDSGEVYLTFARVKNGAQTLEFFRVSYKITNVHMGDES